MVILGCIFCAKTLYYEAYGYGLLLIAFTFFMIMAIGMFFQSVMISRKKLLFSFLFLLLAAVNPSANMQSVVMLMVLLLSGLLATSIVNFDQFASYYVKVIRVLILFSLLSFVVIRFNIPSPLPAAKSIADFYYRNFVVFFVPERAIETQGYRNSGVWWEPGAFQLFINLAFLFEIVIQKVRWKSYIIYALGIVSTISTTGFVIFFLLSFLHFKKTVKKLSTSQIVLLVFITAIAMGIFLLLAKDMIFGKLNQDDTNFASTLSRAYDNLVDWTMLKEHPWLGVGFGNDNARVDYALRLIGPLEYNSGAKPTGSDGLLLLIASLGIGAVFFLLPTLLFPKYLRRFTALERVLFAIVFIFMFNTENLTYTIIFYVLIFFGLTTNSYKKAFNQ